MTDYREEAGIWFVGFVVVSILALVFASMYTGAQDRIGLLGNAICQEERGAEFESFNGKILKCKSLSDYDGIKIDGGVLDVG